jgi:hypothetical protein
MRKAAVRGGQVDQANELNLAVNLIIKMAMGFVTFACKALDQLDAVPIGCIDQEAISAASTLALRRGAGPIGASLDLMPVFLKQSPSQIARSLSPLVCNSIIAHFLNALVPCASRQRFKVLEHACGTRTTSPRQSRLVRQKCYMAAMARLTAMLRVTFLRQRSLSLPLASFFFLQTRCRAGL